MVCFAKLRHFSCFFAVSPTSLFETPLKMANRHEGKLQEVVEIADRPRYAAH